MRRKLTALLALTGTACTTMRVQTEPAPLVVSTEVAEGDGLATAFR